MEFTIKRESPDQTHISALLVKLLSELFDTGLGLPSPAISSEFQAITAYTPDGTLAGVITYKTYESYIWIFLGGVHASYRKQGVYSQMWAELTKLGKEKNLLRIEGATHVNNFQMRALYKKLGRVEKTVSSAYKL